MSLQKTEAIVLKSQNLGETSKIISLYTKKYGIMKVVAKGARGLRSRFYGTLEPLNHIAAVFYYKENRDLQLISQADIIESFRIIKTDLEKLSLALNVCEIILRSQHDEEFNFKLYTTFLEFLKQLNAAKANFINGLFWFQLKFFEISGFRPKLDSCIHCGRKDFGNYDLHFSIGEGGILCNNCQGEGGNGIFLSTAALFFLQKIEKSAGVNVFLFPCAIAVKKQSAMLLNQFMKYHIEGLEQLKSFTFLDNLNHPVTDVKQNRINSEQSTDIKTLTIE